MYDKPLKIALLISLGVHSVIIAPWPNIQLRLPEKPKTEIEVTYFLAEKLPEVEIREGERKIALSGEPVEAKKEASKKEKKPAVKKEEPVKKPAQEQKTVPGQELAAAKKTIPRKSIRIESAPDLSGNISYLSYSELVREKIRQRLYRDYKESMGEGEVALNFLLRSDGSLQDADIAADSDRFNRRLEALCLKSIKHASPFRPFPEELDLPEISFKITISFNSE